jgi:hypothetical protein
VARGFYPCFLLFPYPVSCLLDSTPFPEYSALARNSQLVLACVRDSDRTSEARHHRLGNTYLTRVWQIASYLLSCQSTLVAFQQIQLLSLLIPHVSLPIAISILVFVLRSRREGDEGLSSKVRSVTSKSRVN